MAAHPKLTGDRERRLLAILGLGESLSAACRAVEVSATAVRKRAARDWMFAERLAEARARPEPVLTDWRDAAARLEAMNPLHWSMPEVPEWED